MHAAAEEAHAVKPLAAEETHACAFWNDTVGCCVGARVGVAVVGARVGVPVGNLVGERVGEYVGSCV